MSDTVTNVFSLLSNFFTRSLKFVLQEISVHTLFSHKDRKFTLALIWVQVGSYFSLRPLLMNGENDTTCSSLILNLSLSLSTVLANVSLIWFHVSLFWTISYQFTVFSGCHTISVWIFMYFFSLPMIVIFLVCPHSVQHVWQSGYPSSIAGSFSDFVYFLIFQAYLWQLFSIVLWCTCIVFFAKYPSF